MFTCMPKTGITSYFLLTKLLIKKSYNFKQLRVLCVINSENGFWTFHLLGHNLHWIFVKWVQQRSNSYSEGYPWPNPLTLTAYCSLAELGKKRKWYWKKLNKNKLRVILKRAKIYQSDIFFVSRVLWNKRTSLSLRKSKKIFGNLQHLPSFLSYCTFGRQHFNHDSFIEYSM